MKRPSPALVAEWYGKLRRAGFRDIEGGRDLNALHASTFPGGDGTRGAAFVAWPDTDFEPRVPLSDHPTAVYYRRLEQAAWDLRGPDRALLLCSITGGARDGRVPERTTYWRTARLRARLGLSGDFAKHGRRNVAG